MFDSVMNMPLTCLSTSGFWGNIGKYSTENCYIWALSITYQGFNVTFDGIPIVTTSKIMSVLRNPS